MARLLWVVQKPVYFLGRQWNGVDIASVITLSVVHLIALLAPFYFTWSAFWLGVALYYVTGVGVTLSFHRNLAHKSFKLPKWLEYFFAYCAVHSLQVHHIFSSFHSFHFQLLQSSLQSFEVGFWCLYYREVHQNGLARTGVITSLQTRRVTLILLLRVSGLVILAGFLIFVNVLGVYVEISCSPHLINYMHNFVVELTRTYC